MTGDNHNFSTLEMWGVLWRVLRRSGRDDDADTTWGQICLSDTMVVVVVVVMSLSVQIQGHESQWKLFLYVPHNNF